MLLPNKLFSFDESILSKFPMVLTTLQASPMSVSGLYLKVKNRIVSVNDYIEILDCLFALGKIDYDDKEAAISSLHPMMTALARILRE